MSGKPGMKRRPIAFVVLLTRYWTEVARVQLPNQRKAAPEVVVWDNRVFVKATTGHKEEKYVERPAYWALTRFVTRMNRRRPNLEEAQ